MARVAPGDILTLACRHARVVCLRGTNFSGRSSLLRRVAGWDEQELRFAEGRHNPAIYVGPEIYNSISGLASTVDDELGLHGFRGTTLSLVKSLIATAELDRLFQRNPFLLSGGEQACLVVISSLLLSPALLALDGAFEQLAPELRRRILTTLQTADQVSGQIIISDNRVSELGPLVESIPVQECLQTRSQDTLLPIRSLCSDAISSMPARDAKRVVLDGISFKYPRGPEVLRNACIVLEPGQPYVLTGKNGCGKSTFAKLLVGVLRPTRGKMILGDLLFAPWYRPGQLFGYHFQNPDLQLFETSVIAELHGGKRASHRGTASDNTQSAMILEAFGLTHIPHVHPLGLSFPFVLRKRVALAATLNMPTDWLILDEPTLGQDDAATKAIAEMVHTLARLGKGIIVISHSLNLIDLLRAKHLALADGEIFVQ